MGIKERLQQAHDNLTNHNKWDHETRPDNCPWEKLRVAHVHLNQRPWDFTIDPEVWQLGLKGYNTAFGLVGKDDASLAEEFEKIDTDNTGSKHAHTPRDTNFAAPKRSSLIEDAPAHVLL